ncbi:hypothetical protein [[Phormidium ambiguum] IAM M-71]|nr:hypothetical protein [Phormidium ambiguum]
MLSCHDKKAGLKSFFPLLDEFEQPDENIDKAEEQNTNGILKL